LLTEDFFSKKEKELNSARAQFMKENEELKLKNKSMASDLLDIRKKY